MTHTLWLGMQITHPADWECAQLGLDANHSRCVLVDRYTQRLDVQWRPSRAQPDLQKMFEQYRREAGRDAQEEIVLGGGWCGFLRRDGEKLVTQAGKYFDSPGRLVELALVFPGPRDKALERKILGGIAPQPAGKRRQWQALGLSVEVPAEMRLGQYKALPGHVWFRFDSRDGSLTVHRLGAIEQWLKQPLPQWLEQRMAGARVLENRSTNVNGHEAAEIVAAVKLPRWRRWLARKAISITRAWICKSEQKVYLVEWNPRDARQPAMPELSVGCCRPINIPAEDSPR